MFWNKEKEFMFASEEGKRVIAKSLTHYVYRNLNAVEELHSKNVTLNLAIYKKIYDSVRGKMRRVLEFHWYFNKLRGKTLEELDIEKQASQFKKKKRRQFVDYVQALLFNTYMGAGWDEPDEIKPPRAGKVLVGYLLAGEFKASCIRGDEFNDEAMKRINKDIYSRMYALVLSSKLCKEPYDETI